MDPVFQIPVRMSVVRKEIVDLFLDTREWANHLSRQALLPCVCMNPTPDQHISAELGG
jgi:hypothetical protein